MTKLPISTSLPVGSLAAIFNNTTNSYKLYWFYAILQAVKYEDKQVFSIDEIIARMIASTWYSINFFKISLGKQDKLREAVQEIKENTQIKDDELEEVVINEILNQLNHSKTLKRICNNFQRYVPFRLLSPFFSSELRGVKDTDKNKMIIQLASSSFSDYYLPTSIYRFVSKESLEFHPSWLRYFKNNIKILEDFCLWNLTKYLQTKNPHIPNIGEKIFAPSLNRNLSTARKYWNLVFKYQKINCIFSKSLVNPSSYSIDHFLPWSFVVHDMLWNLAPISKEVNSSKNNRIPNLTLYFQNFANLHYDAFQLIYGLKKFSMMTDYCVLFDDRVEDIAKLSCEDFSLKLRNHIFPLSQIAENSGFVGEWVYK